MKNKKILFASLAVLVFLAFFGIHQMMSSINLEKGLTFNDYILTGTPEQQARQMLRVRQTGISEFFISEIKKIDKPVFVISISSPACPDCTVITPFLLAMELANPNIQVKFYKLTRGTKNLLLYRTRQAYIPTVFLATPEGKLYKDNFIERPRAVHALTKTAKTDDERKTVVLDFRSGKYNAEIEKELLGLLQGIN